MEAIQNQLVRKQIMLTNGNVDKLTLIARQNKTSVAKVVRNAVNSYDPDREDELTGLIELLNNKLDKAIIKTEKTEKYVVETLNSLSTRKRIK